MSRSKVNTARLLAPIALIAVLVAVVIVSSGSLGGGSGSNGGGGTDGGGGASSQQERRQKPSDKVYVVEPGDSLSVISEKTGVSLDRLLRLNPDLDPQALVSGEKVRLRR